MKPSVRRLLEISLFSLLSLVVVASTFVLGYAARAAQEPVTDDAVQFGVFWEAWNLVNEYFYGDSSNEKARTYGAIEGSVRALDDPYTLFIEPQQRDREEEELRGSFGGIGAMVERTPEGRILLTPMEGRPAAQAGDCYCHPDRASRTRNAPLRCARRMRKSDYVPPMSRFWDACRRMKR